MTLALLVSEGAAIDRLSAHAPLDASQRVVQVRRDYNVWVAVFMPEYSPGNRRRWWAGVLVGGPGGVLPGVIKMLARTRLVWRAINHAVPVEHAVDPSQMDVVAGNMSFPTTAGRWQRRRCSW